MRTLEEITAEATTANVQLRLNMQGLSRAASAGVEGLFHAPLLALTILVIAKARRNGVPTSDVATWALGTLMRKFADLRFVRTDIQWSVPLRRRCAEALVFLENVGLAIVKEAPTRTIYIADSGKTLVRKLTLSADESGVLVRELERAYRAVDQGGLELL